MVHRFNQSTVASSLPHFRHPSRPLSSFGGLNAAKGEGNCCRSLENEENDHFKPQDENAGRGPKSQSDPKLFRNRIGRLDSLFHRCFFHTKLHDSIESPNLWSVSSGPCWRDLNQINFLHHVSRTSFQSSRSFYTKFDSGLTHEKLAWFSTCLSLPSLGNFQRNCWVPLQNCTDQESYSPLHGLAWWFTAANFWGKFQPVIHWDGLESNMEAWDRVMVIKKYIIYCKSKDRTKSMNKPVILVESSL